MMENVTPFQYGGVFFLHIQSMKFQGGCTVPSRKTKRLEPQKTREISEGVSIQPSAVHASIHASPNKKLPPICPPFRQSNKPWRQPNGQRFGTSWFTNHGCLKGRSFWCQNPKKRRANLGGVEVWRFRRGPVFWLGNGTVKKVASWSRFVNHLASWKMQNASVSSSSSSS